MTLNKKHVLLFLSIFVIMLIGATAISATTDINNVQGVKDNEELSTPTNDVDNMVQSSVSKTNLDANVENSITSDNNTKTITETSNNKEKTLSEKIIIKNIQTNTKTESISQSVNNYQELYNLLTTSNTEDLTVNLEGTDEDYIITDRIEISSDIKTLVINGNHITINGNEEYGFLTIYDTLKLTLNDIIVKNCYEYWDGAVIIDEAGADIIINNSQFENNKVEEWGGVIYQSASDEVKLLINNSIFKNNFAGEMGGVLYIDTPSESFIYNSLFEGNIADDNSMAQGGAISLISSTNMTIVNTNFTSNYAYYEGGAIYTRSADDGIYVNLVINDSIFKENSVTMDEESHGGAILSGKSLELNRCNFTKNSAIQGGAISYNYNITVNDSNFTENNADNGGAISDPWSRFFFEIDYDGHAKLSDAYLIGYTTISNSKFENNTAKYGAALYESPYLYIGDEDEGYTIDYENNIVIFTDDFGDTVTFDLNNPVGNVISITNSEFINNKAEEEAGVIYLKNSMETSVKNTNFTSNKAKQGGVISNLNKGNLSITGSNFTSNYASNNATIIRINEITGLITLENNIFDSNWVGNDDGWVITVDNNTKINNNLFVNNTDNARDMLFDNKASEVSGNIYIDNYLNDTMDTIEDSIITDTFEKEVNLNLREVYNDLIRNGTLKVYVNNNTEASYEEEVTDGKATITISSSVLPEKENTITLKYVTLSKHYQNMTTTFKLTKDSSNTNITVTANSTVKVGQDVTITGKLFEEDDESKVIPQADIKIYVNGENVKNVTTNATGEYTFEYTTEKLGEHSVDVVFEKTSDYGESSNNTTFIVLPLDTNMTINAENVTIGEYTTITGTLYDIDNNISIPNKNLIVRIGDNFINDSVSVDEEGNYKLYYEPTSIGDYTVRIIYTSEDENYTSSINTTKFTVYDKIETDTFVEILNNTAGNVTLKISVEGKDGNNSMTGYAIITIDGHNKINLELTGEPSYIVNLKDNITRSGEVGLSVEFTGNKYYYPSKAMKSVDEYLTKIDVINQTPTLNVGVLEEPVLNSTTVTIMGNLTDDLENNLSDASIEIFVNDENIGTVKTNSTGGFTLEYPTNQTGENTVKAVYYGDNKRYSNQTDNTVFNVYKLNTTAYLNVSDIEYGQTELMNISINETNATGNVYVEVNSTVGGFRNITYIYPFNGDIIQIKVPGLYAGVYDVTLRYDGDSRYNGNNTKQTFTVNKKTDYNLSVTATNITYGEEETITVSLPEEADGNVTINVTGQDSRTFNITKTKTTVFAAYTLSAGEYEVNISYTDDDYALKTNTTTFKVEKAASNVDVSAENITKGYNETITVTLPEYEHATGKIKVIVYDSTEEEVYSYTIDCPNNLENGINITSIPGLTNGTYFVVADFTDDPNFNSSGAVAEFEVTLPSIKIYDSKEIFIDESAQVHGTVKDNNNPNIEGNILLNVNGTPTQLSLEEYEKGIDLTFNKEGIYTVNATYILFGEEIVTSENIYITVNKHNTTITVNELEPVKAGNSTIITGVLVDEQNRPISGATVVVKVNDTIVGTVTTDENGIYNKPFNNTIVGTHNVTSTYSGNDTYIGSEATTTFEVQKIDTNINIDEIEDVPLGEKVTITGKLVDEFQEPIKETEINVTFDGTTQTVKTDNEGNYEATFTTDNVGEKTVTAQYNGSDIYNNSTSTSKVNVNPKTVKITVEVPENATPGIPTNITGTLTDTEANPLSGVPVNVTVNNETYTATTNPDGTYTVEVPGENVVEGRNSVTVTAGNENITTQPVQDSFEATKHNSTITINPINNVTVGDNVKVTGKLVDEESNPIVNAEVNVTLDGTSKIVTTDDEGNYEATFPTSEVKTELVQAEYYGNKSYKGDGDATMVNVTKESGTIKVEMPEDAKAGQPTTITGKVENAGEGLPVNITVNGKTYETITDAEGNYKVDVNGTDITDGENTVTVTAENETFTTQPANTEFTAEKVNTTLTVDPISDVIVGSDATISGTLTDNEGNPVADAEVTVTVDGLSQTVKTDNEGKYTASFPTNKVTEKPVGVEYLGNDKYNGAKADDTLKVVKNTATNTVELPDDAKVGEPTSIKGKITDKDGNPVANIPVNVTINGKTIQTITDASGNYEVEANNVVEGTNNVTVTAGNDNVDVENAAGTFDATKKDASLTVDPIKDAKVGEDVTITGKLVDEQENPITNAPVKVTVNGKTYTVVTDENGNYELTVPEVVEGLNNVSVSYTNDKYNTQSANTTFEATKAKTIVTVPSITGIVGEKITLTAYVTDEDGNPVTGGNLVFKLNGRTLREDGRFDTDDANPLKFKVENGIVTYTMTADLYIRAGKNITASYSGSYKYEAAKGNIAEANIKKRTAQISVTVTPNPTKQNTDIVFTATLDDITKDAENTTALTTNGSVLFKLNGVSLKDAEGNANWVPATRSVVNLVYHVPTGTGGVDENGLKNYTVEAVYDNPAFYPDTRNTTVYNVERSIVNINFIKTSVSNDVLSVKATFTDYENNYLVGNNKICVKINGKTYQENGKTKYFTVHDGKVDLTGIKLSSGTKVKSVMLVTGDRQAYLGARATTTDITTS